MYISHRSSTWNEERGQPRKVCFITALVAFLLLPTFGCRKAGLANQFGANTAEIEERNRRQGLESELRDASAEEVSLSDVLRAKMQESVEISARIDSDRQALSELETTTRAYMQEHDTAVAAILAGAASTDVFGDRQTSDEAKQVSLGVGVIVLIWAATHQEELSAVIRTLEAAKDSRLSLQQDLQQAVSISNFQKEHIDNLKLKDSEAREKIGLLRAALCGSACGHNS